MYSYRDDTLDIVVACLMSFCLWSTTSQLTALDNDVLWCLLHDPSMPRRTKSFQQCDPVAVTTCLRAHAGPNYTNCPAASMV